ncbi:hypothetical protein HPP92_012734 [Vanilla planifolia]|uniref:Uncharacterized protein n=1 Tax=Vanilla planifolia TaxID=51239 RepID=A0A835QWR2_VANPL|nr:hypothetical protein HPP92_012734 [Vanilla planifolia]
MQSRVHQLQQQLAALLSAALPQSISNATNDVHAADAPPSPSLTEAAASGIGINDSARIAALESCRRTVLYPPNALLLPHCAHFLSQGFTQLLADKSYGVRHAAAVAYGSLCAILVSAAFSSNALSNHVLAGSLVDRFLAWALPSFHDFSIRNNSAELALDSLQEFLSAGNAVSVERYVPSILKASQELLEDERTSFSLFNQLLSLLTLISSKFVHCFQPHFFDIVDLLLGWTFMPDLPDPERSLITDSFFQFQKHWLSNLQFSLSLLSKLLGDAEVLMNDVSIETTPQLRRSISLFSCFSTILQSTASGVLEMNLLDHVSEPLENLTPMLLRCILVFGKKFGWSKWMGGSWKCLGLIAEILLEKFSHYYPMVIDILFHTLREVTSDQVLRLLKTNLKLLSLQKLGLLPSSVQILLKFHSPLSQLRLHSNHSIVAGSAATYLFFLQHGSCDIVSQAITCIFEELEQLKSVLAELRLHVITCCQMVGTRIDGKNKSSLSNGRQYSELDLLSLLKFDLEVLSSTTSVDCPSNSEVSADCVTLAERSARVTSFILNKFVPFEFPIEGFCELQVHAIRTLCKLSEVEFLVQLDDCAKLLNKASVVMDSNDHPVLRGINKQRFLANEYLRKFSGSMARALTVSLPLGTKLEGLGWIRTFTLMVLSIKKGEQLMGAFSGPYQDVKISDVLFFSILDAAFDGEVKVRYQVASVLELLLQAGLIHPENFCFISEVVFNRLTDPETSIKISFVRLLSISVPLTLYINGITDDCYFWKLKTTSYAYPCYLNWKKALALKKMHRKLHSQQFLSVFSYLSQRLKAPLSYWIRRLVFSCHDRKDRANQQELIGGFDYMDVCKDSREEEFVHEKIYPINNLAAIWWSIHEAARYCIDIRLRTTLGGPTQTFASLERMLCDIPNMLQVDFEPNNDQYWSLSNFHLLPVRLLLDFVECLKKNVYNAYDGSSILPSPTGQSSLFFEQTRKFVRNGFFNL